MQIANHTQIPNSVIDNMMFLSGSELKVFVAICRKTIGWHKKTDRISHSQIRKMTGLSINSLRKGIDGLKDKKIIVQENTNLGYIYEINYTVSINDIANIDIAEIDEGVSKIDIKKGKIVSKNATTKDIYKETIQKIYIYWNSKDIQVHNKLTDKMKTKIKSALKDYSVDEIKKSIDNYAKVLKGMKYYFDYKWTLKDFMSRGVDKFLDDVCFTNYLSDKEKLKYQPKQKPLVESKSPDFDDEKPTPERSAEIHQEIKDSLGNKQ